MKSLGVYRHGTVPDIVDKTELENEDAAAEVTKHSE
jgi:hypothetical protein